MFLLEHSNHMTIIQGFLHLLLELISKTNFLQLPKQCLARTLNRLTIGLAWRVQLMKIPIQRIIYSDPRYPGLTRNLFNPHVLRKQLELLHIN